MAILGTVLNTVDALAGLTWLTRTTVRACNSLCSPCAGAAMPFILFVAVPVLVCVATSAIACVLSVVESWTIRDSFLYAMSNVLGLANPLTGDSPTTTSGVVRASNRSKPLEGIHTRLARRRRTPQRPSLISS